MKVLAVNGSPRQRMSSTSRLLEALLAGMSDAGATTRLVQLGALDLRPCTGCFTCWVRTPGECIHRDRDGMAGILDAWREADLVVFGTPLYYFTMTGVMKTFIDRLLPEVEPWLVADPRRPGETTHPRRHPRARPLRAFLVSPCGFPERAHFAPLLLTFRTIAERHGWEWLGELLRPGAEPLSRAALAPLFAPYLADVRRAGAALVADGRIPDPLAEALARDLLPGGREAFRDRANRYWSDLRARHARPDAGAVPPAEDDLDLPGEAPHDALATAERPPSHDALRTAERPASCRSLVAGMASAFDPAAGAGLDARIEFRIGGTEPGTYHLAIGAGACRFADGPAASPALTVEAPADVWTAIATGRLDGQRALLGGAYRVSGDIALLLRMGALFRGARAAP